MTTPPSMQANERFRRLQALVEQLLPGIPDEITFNHIAPKLRWTDFNSLSSVSHAWLHAIRTHRVYDARVRSHSTETLLLLKFRDSDWFHKIALFDTRENSFHQLPPIPNVEGGFSRRCELVILDGKVYVLGGMVERKNGHHSTDKVYVLDLAGRRQWKQCAGMRNSRMRFGCGVLNGKIYVFGGLSSNQPVPGSEVYNAAENTWSPVKPMLSLGYDQCVETLEAELFVHSGMKCDRDYFDSKKSQMINSDGSSDDDSNDDDDDHIEGAKSLEIYHPGKAEWREVKPFHTPHMSKLFVAHGKIHGMQNTVSPSGYVHSSVYDLDTNSWDHQHSFSFAAIESNRDSVGVFPDLDTNSWDNQHSFSFAAFESNRDSSVRVFPCSVLVVDHKLFALVSWYKRSEGYEKRRYALLQSKKFGSKDKVFSSARLLMNLIEKLNPENYFIIWQPKAHFLPSAFGSAVTEAETLSVIKL